MHQRFSSAARRVLVSIAAAAMLALAGPVTATPGGMSMAEVADKASAESKSQQVIERLPGGRVRMTAPMQDLEALIGVEGALLRSTDEAGDASFHWQVKGVGRGPAVALLWGGEVSIAGDVVQVRRPGVVEEFRVSADGLRQDFVVPSRPGGDGELVVDLTAHGASLAPVDGHDGRAVAVRMSDGRVLHYRQLKVADARGQPLAARMALTESGVLRIAVDDAQAAYPVRIDPTFSDADWSALDVPGFDISIDAMVATGTQVFVGGRFGAANGGVLANRVAVWNGTSWAALGTGMNGDVYALAWDSANQRLFAGGSFSSAGGISANRVAVWDGSAWSPLGSGVRFLSGAPSTVRALLWEPVSGHLYAGGDFDIAGGLSASQIARWNGSTWGALGTGTSSGVRALAWDPAAGHLYAGGDFAAAGGVTVYFAARWNGSTWSALGAGLNSPVYALAWDGVGNRLFVGGDFTSAAGASVNYVAAWNGSVWSSLGSGMNSFVRSLAWDADSNALYVGGFFSHAGGLLAPRVAKWSGGAWTALGTGISIGLGNATVNALAWDPLNSRLYAAGIFSVAGGSAASHFAVWSDGSWSALGGGMDSSVFALAWDAAGRRLFAGGNFLTAGNQAVNFISVWNGSSWSALGSGMNNNVRTLAWDESGGRLFAGGAFTSAGGVPVNYVAVWNGSSWASLGTGANSFVMDLVWDASAGQLYAAGSFTSVGGVAASSIHPS